MCTVKAYWKSRTQEPGLGIQDTYIGHGNQDPLLGIQDPQAGSGTQDLYVGPKTWNPPPGTLHRGPGTRGSISGTLFKEQIDETKIRKHILFIRAQFVLV